MSLLHAEYLKLSRRRLYYMMVIILAALVGLLAFFLLIFAQIAPELAEGVPVLYGDATDAELLDHVPLDHARWVVSTAPDIGQWMFSIGTNSSTMVRRPPARPAKKPEIAKATSRTRLVS